MNITKGFSLPEEIVKLIHEDALRDPVAHGNDSAILRSILTVHYKERLESAKEQKVAA